MDTSFGFQSILNQTDVNASTIFFPTLTTNSLVCINSTANMDTATIGSGLTFAGTTLAVSPSYIRGLFSETNANLTYDNTTGVIGLTDTPTFGSLTLTGLSGIVKASAGLLSASATTTDLPEGTNLYYTTARQNTDFDTRLATKSTTNLAEGTNLYYTDARARASVSASGSNLSYNSSTGAFSFTSTPSFLGLTIGTLTGIPKCLAGLITGSATTSDCPEGSNLYYLDSRARAALSAGTGISYNSSTGAIANSGVLSITGTSNQVLANGLGGTTQTGAVTLSLSTNQNLSSDTVSSIRMEVAGSSYPAFTYKRANGSLATRTSVALNDYLQRSIAQGYNAGVGGYVDSAAIDYQIDAAPDLVSGGTPSSIIFSTNSGTSTSISEKMRVQSNGYVGIGESSPDLRFVSRNTATVAQISARYSGTAPANYKELQLGYNGASGNGYGWLQAVANGVAYTPLSLQLNGGYVGIGTNNPEDILHIAKSGSGSVGPRIILDNTAALATNNQCEISFLTDSGATGSSYNANIKAVADGSGYGYTALTFGTYGGTSTPAERMRISPNGYVGIGTTNPQFPLHVKYSSAPQIVVDDNNTGAADIRHYVYGVMTGIHFANSTSLQLRSIPNIPLYLGYNSDIQVTIGDTTNGYPTAMTISNQTTGPALKLQESTGTGRGHIQIGSSSTATNNIHFGCEGDGAFYVWNGNWGAGSQKFCINSLGNFRSDNASGYNTSALYGAGGSYFTMYNSTTGSSSQIGHDGPNMWINTGAGGTMAFSTYSAGYAALVGRMLLDQAGRLSFNSMTANATLSLFGTSAAPLAGICMAGYGYDATPYHRLELGNGSGAYQYYMSQNIVWSSANNRWEFVSAGGWGGYGSMLDFYGNGNVQFRTATNVAGLPSLKTNLDMTNDGNCAMGYNLNVAGTLQVTPATPASSSATGSSGQIKWDASYIYVCTATNTWKRVALSTF